MWKRLGLAAIVAAGSVLGFRTAATPSEAGPPAPAEVASPWAATQHGGVRLIAGVEATGQGESVPVGLEFRMNPGWHIYWRSPGDAGFPPRADWSRSVNLASAETMWPLPRRFSVNDLETIGYETAVVLPIDARLQRPGEALSLLATVDYLTCAEICIPYTADLSLELPAGAALPSAAAADLAQAGALVPGADTGQGLSLEAVTLAGTAQAPALVLDVASPEPLALPDVFIEAPPPLAFSAPAVERRSDARKATLIVRVYNIDQAAQPLAGLPVKVTLVDGERAVEQLVTVGAAGNAAFRPVAAPPPLGLPVVLALALLGGLVLNLMPCVLPVLSMKLLAVVGHGGGDRRMVRLGFVATAAGILFSFLLLAAGLIGLKAAGASVGWGLQFQQPWFLTAMVLVVTLFACNLWGLLEVPMPRLLGLADQRAARVQGLAGHFLTGAFASLLATPCSAPFLGTAVGFALAGSPGDIVLVFATIACGLALPYLAIAMFPTLVTRLPRPGRWMTVLRRLLGVALAATAAWLVSVLAGRAGAPAALTVGALAAGIAVLLALRAMLPPHLKPAGVAGVLALLAAALILPREAARTNEALRAERASAGGLWQPFEPDLITAAVAKGQIVFVNVTADWCLTCKVNQRLVLERDPVRQRLGQADVVAMQGDWTAPDERISRYLATFGRYGIPFDAVYGPALPQGEALPELLSADLVIRALARADAAAEAGNAAGTKDSADTRAEAARR